MSPTRDSPRHRFSDNKSIMKTAILWLISVLYVVSASGQKFNRYDFQVNDKDTVINIPNGSKTRYVYHARRSDDSVHYSLLLYEDFSTYVLQISLPSQPSLFEGLPGHSSPIIISTLSWGDYRICGNKMFLNDRIAGFKMETSIESDEVRFCRNYFPGMNKRVWDMYPPEEEEERESGYSEFYAIFDNKKAERFRKDYDQKYREPFELAAGVYNASLNSLEIAENGQWKQKYGDLVLAEGEWRRKRNIIILNCPKLKCNFYITIGDKRLGSMLLLGDIFGIYLFNQSEYEKYFSL